MPPSQVQQIYLIRDFQKKKGPPTNYIKIPLSSESVKIVELQTERKKKKKSRRKEERVHMEQLSCENCKFCMIANQRRDFMRHVNERLSVLQMRQDVETEDIVIGQFQTDHSYLERERLKKLDVEVKMKHLEVHNKIRHLNNDNRSSFIEGDRSGHTGGNRSNNFEEEERSTFQHPFRNFYTSGEPVQFKTMNRFEGRSNFFHYYPTDDMEE